MGWLTRTIRSLPGSYKNLRGGVLRMTSPVYRAARTVVAIGKHVDAISASLEKIPLVGDVVSELRLEPVYQHVLSGLNLADRRLGQLEAVAKFTDKAVTAGIAELQKPEALEIAGRLEEKIDIKTKDIQRRGGELLKETQSIRDQFRVASAGRPALRVSGMN